MPLYVYTEALSPAQCAEFDGLPEDVKPNEPYVRIKEMPVMLVAIEETSRKKATRKAKSIIEEALRVK